MCGIAGIFHFDRTRQVDPSHLSAMSDALAHRGPDGQGLWRGGHVGLATRRLAIVDIANGALPMVNLRRTRVLAYSGEIFNFRELRAELEARGHVFRTRSDAEVALAAYEHYGEACVEWFNGQFAFAIWDADRDALFLARDPVGICPLHYSVTAGSFRFASEIKALLAAPGIAPRADQSAIADQLVAGCLASGATLFQDIRTLPPGHCMWVDGGPVRACRYWAPPTRAPARSGADEAGLDAAMRAMLEEAVRIRLSRETGWGVLLSGGIDSSTITLLAAAAGRNFTAYTIDYANPWKGPHTDRHFAAMLAAQAGCRHEVFDCDPADYFDALAEVVRVVEQPFNKAAVTGWLLYQRILGREKVLLCGDGADELFGGYVASPGMAFRKDSLSSETGFPWAAHGDLAIELLDPDFLAATDPLERRREAKRVAIREAGELDPLNRYLFLYMTIFLPEILLLQDKASYAAGIETRYPFLDRPFIDAFFALPARLKLGDGREKALIRSMAAAMLPPPILGRTKSHLPIPRDPAALRMQSRVAADLLLAPGSRTIKYFRKEKIEQLVAETGGHENTDPVKRWQLMMYLTTLELHHRQFDL